MKTKRIIVPLLVALAVICLSGSAFAASFSDFTDVSGHWAEETIHKGFDDGLISGFEDATIKPDAPITTAQMITILCRVLGASETADTTALNLPPDAWYSAAAGQALHLGLISPQIGSLDAPMTRQNAFALLSRAFSLEPAQTDLTVLAPFSDSGNISAANKNAMAALVSRQVVQGFGSTLNVNGSITRAEFLTILYRVAASYINPFELNVNTFGGVVLKGSGTLNNLSLGDNIWFDCAAETVSLNALTAKSLTLRSHALSSLSIGGGTSLDRLVLDCGSYDFSLPAGSAAKIGTVQLAGSGKAELLDSAATNIEITGKGISAKIGGVHESLIISGNGNTIELSSGAEISRLLVLGSDNKLVFGENSSLSQISVSGAHNNITTKGKHSGTVSLGGKENLLFINSSEALSDVSVSGQGNWLTLACTDINSLSLDGGSNTVHKTSPGKLQSLTIPGSGNAFVLYVGNTLPLAKISGSGNTLTADGTIDDIHITGRKTILNGKGSGGSLVLDSSGCSITLPIAKLTDNSEKNDEARVLKLVTQGYKGNYTLKWAQEHDYEDFEKEIWVNAKGYSSSTNYLIWVNIGMQRVNIFEGSAGNFKLVHSAIVGTGANGSPTPYGVWTTTYKQKAGWTTSTYTCRPVVGFRSGTGYAFHSRLYYPNSNKLTDASIGFPVSHGCVRMYDEDINYIFNKIPANTSVVVF
ncbi:MAG: S-layer homology domain-containing protein [Oscillospiraceae bacterium]